MKTTDEGSDRPSRKSLPSSLRYVEDAPVGATGNDDQPVFSINDHRHFILELIQPLDTFVQYAEPGKRGGTVPAFCPRQQEKAGSELEQLIDFKRRGYQ